MSGTLRVRVASAGTGKTTVLVARYLELIGAGVPLRRIAGATFTRAAAGELRQRVAAASGTCSQTVLFWTSSHCSPGRKNGSPKPAGNCPERCSPPSADSWCASCA